MTAESYYSLPVAAVSSRLLKSAFILMLARGDGQEAMGKKGFKDLLVWQMAKDLAAKVYRASESKGLKKDFGLRDQIRRSAVSVASNLAEGDERGMDRDAVRFFYMAKGSLAEHRTQIQIACETGYVRKPLYDSLEAEHAQLGKMIGSLIRARSQPSGLSPHASSLD